MGRDRVAVVGAGVAGLVTAYLLRERYEVVLFEAGDHLGGHVTTHVVPAGPDRGLVLDLGFMVMNRPNYPLFCRLLAELGVGDIGPSEMSFGYREEGTGFQYVLNWDRGGDLWQELAGLLPAILRFQRAAASLGDGEYGGGEPTLGEFLARHDLRGDVVDRYLIPMTAAIWSADLPRMLEFPVRPLLAFLAHHGLLSLEKGPRWEHVHGGAARYVEALVARLPPATIERRRVRCVRRRAGGVEVVVDGALHRVERAVLACHADEALSLLADASPEEAAALAGWSYQRNVAVLHTDEAAMPPARAAWASWNFVRHPGGAGRLGVTYHLNRLQGHLESHAQYFVTLDAARGVDESKVLTRVEFTHPVYGPASLAAAKRLRALNAAGPVLFCGSYMGHGFHEDAVRSAHDVARALGVGT
jgi:predicted NAD/FAD-binding protein